VVVTGASSGVGRETALAFARRRARLVIASRSRESLEDVAAECLQAGASEVIVHPTDIADAEQVDALFTTAVDRFGGVDVAAQCAATTVFGRFDSVPPSVFEAVVRTNLIGGANVARSAMGVFETAGTGQLILVGSLLGFTAVPFQSPYVLSKFGIAALVRVLRQENRHLPRVRIHGVHPGPVDTPVYGAAANFLGRAPRIPPGAASPATVATAIVRIAAGRRSRQRQLGWVNVPSILVYKLLPTLFDRGIADFLDRIAFTVKPVDVTEGNVFPDATGPAASSPPT
jgi:NAD(P)-dependent dehydrogenase (short-subunit alcohol dehydrogenase family)